MKIRLIYLLFIIALASCQKKGNDIFDTKSASETGKSGSMARFTVANGSLFVLENNNIRSYSLTDPSTPSLSASSYVAEDIETVYPYQDKIFIGSQSGMYIFEANDGQLQYRSFFEHIRSCDPVVADSNYAFITLNSVSSQCWNSSNELQVVDITNLDQPKFITSYPMSEPYGLGIDQNLLFVCDNGLKVYDRSNVNNLNQLAYFKDIKPYDVIPYDSVLLVTADEGLAFYEYKNNEINLLSKINKSIH